MVPLASSTDTGIRHAADVLVMHLVQTVNPGGKGSQQVLLCNGILPEIQGLQCHRAVAKRCSVDETIEDFSLCEKGTRNSTCWNETGHEIVGLAPAIFAPGADGKNENPERIFGFQSGISFTTAAEGTDKLTF